MSLRQEYPDTKNIVPDECIFWNPRAIMAVYGPPPWIFQTHVAAKEAAKVFRGYMLQFEQEKLNRHQLHLNQLQGGGGMPQQDMGPYSRNTRGMSRGRTQNTMPEDGAMSARRPSSFRASLAARPSSRQGRQPSFGNGPGGSSGFPPSPSGPPWNTPNTNSRTKQFTLSAQGPPGSQPRGRSNTRSIMPPTYGGGGGGGQSQGYPPMSQAPITTSKGSRFSLPRSLSRSKSQTPSAPKLDPNTRNGSSDPRFMQGFFGRKKAEEARMCGPDPPRGRTALIRDSYGGMDASRLRQAPQTQGLRRSQSQPGRPSGYNQAQQRPPTQYGPPPGQAQGRPSSKSQRGRNQPHQAYIPEVPFSQNQPFTLHNDGKDAGRRPRSQSQPPMPGGGGGYAGQRAHSQSRMPGGGRGFAGPPGPHRDRASFGGRNRNFGGTF